MDHNSTTSLHKFTSIVTRFNIVNIFPKYGIAILYLDTLDTFLTFSPVEKVKKVRSNHQSYQKKGPRTVDIDYYGNNFCTIQKQDILTRIAEI